ncbi:MAG: multiple sugar transport system permease protein [Pseudonocardiales bacterium]|jgi:multiple sugar transport system permease protein|nr:multiple sugar transport system permease protein [Pseudonocardiales bacterium]MDT7694599.1 multiple sugar transport system permease protein [Pseudonocardiales bacterium]
MATPVSSPARPGDSPPAPAAPPVERRRARWSGHGGALPYLLLAPALVFELVVHVIPMITGVVISFLKLNQFYLRHWLDAPFAGLANYQLSLDFHSEIGVDLLRSVAITIAYSVVVVSFSWLFGIFGATLLQRSMRGRAALRTIFLIPYALPVFTSVIVWKFMLNQDNGLVNHVLAQLHLGSGKHFWLLGDSAFFSMALVGVWRLWPFALLTLMAGMQSIPTDLYEAAEVDGANRWQQFRKLTVPMLRPVNQVLVLVLFLWTFNDFNVPYTLFAGSTPASADLISVHIKQSSFITWNFGLGSAMSVLLLLFLLVVTVGYLAVTSRRTRDA